MILGQSYNLVVHLGLEPIVDAVVEVKKPESLTFEEVIVLPDDFNETEYGYYNIYINASIIDQLGTYVFRISGYELEVFVERDANPAPPYSVESPDVCVVTGNVKNASGSIAPFSQVPVEGRPLKLPYETSGTHVLGEKVIVYSDHNGYFQLPLLRGMTAIIEVRDAAIRFQAVIPDQATIRLEDLMP